MSFVCLCSWINSLGDLTLQYWQKLFSDNEIPFLVLCEKYPPDLVPSSMSETYRFTVGSLKMRSCRS